MTSSGKRIRASALPLSIVLAGVLLTACQGTPAGPGSTAPSTAPASPRTNVTASPGTTAMDGRTIGTPDAKACQVPGVQEARQKLGAVASQLQPAVQSVTENQGVKETSCIFSLVTVPSGQDPDPNNALTITTTVYPDAAALAKVELPRMMISPTPVQAGQRAWYARNQLSSSTEYVLESASKNVITRITLAVPVQTAAVEQAQEKLTGLLPPS
ncbi:hypothetical protein GCM10027405_37950 [Arthrobacter alkaliphilus]|uniref:hypothetical protein n=1 Tax=Arthrobacter alkaliphilus TaxID=369936 RepID=UPI001F3C1298|nr:hypothetical protein [Arthrobacter alkaliphilus]